MQGASTEQRRLAAIMFTDMVGYSALAQRSEALALELLEEHRRLLREVFPKFGGREVETTGDGFLVEFASALEAARCGIQIQRTLAVRNISIPVERAIRLRIGIHVGDVVHKEGHVLGDGVNIAARLQPQAEPGGICVSVDVERQIRNALEARIERIGAAELKNIQGPMELFRIVMPWETGSGGGLKPGVPHPRSRRGLTLAAGVALGLAAALWFGLHRATSPARQGAPTATPGGENRTKPARIQWLVVLPLRNYAGDTNQDYFVDGMTDLLSGELAQINGLQVKSHQTAMRYKGSSKTVPEIARELSVDAVVEGSVQRSGNRVLVSVQLIETATDRHLWARKYEREVSDLLKMQGEITEDVAKEIEAKLSPQQQTRLAASQTVNPAALEAYLKARFYWSKRTNEGMHAAVDYCQRAVAIDPGYAAALALLGDCLTLLPFYVGGWGQESIDKARGALMKALELDPTLGEVHGTLGFLKLQSDLDLAGARREFEQALVLAPNSATTHQRYGLLFLTEGRFDEALAQRKRSAELDPLSRIVKVELSDVFFFRREYEAAIKGYREILLLDPDFARAHWMLGRVLAEQGQYESAIAELREACRLSQNSGYLLATLGRVHGLAGHRAQAQEILKALQDPAQYPQTLAGNIAVVHIGLGNKDEAFRWIEKTFEEHYAPLLLKVDPQFDPLRPDPRFPALLKRLGLVE
jgi:class 3 adenylate cyclase/TolB-like protein/Tfp pilus assembly protein PilF